MDEKRSPLDGVKEILMGATGTGKTTSMKHWIEAGLEVRAIFTEPSFEVIADITCAEGLHFVYTPPNTASWDTLLDSAKKINTFDYKGLAGMNDISKNKYQEFMDVIKHCNKFVCQRCNKDFGSVDTWGTNVVFALDSLSGLSTMAMNLVVGSKPAKSQPDWGVAMDNLKRFIERITTVHCHFLLVAHIERETEEVSGAIHTTLSTLGRKLAPQIVLNFSDVVLAKKNGDKFLWSTTELNTDLKARNLPLSDKLPPGITAILEKWKSRGGIIEVLAAQTK